MLGGPFELYDIKNDPRERHNLIDAEPAMAESLKTILFAWMAENQPPEAPERPETIKVDQETEDALRALGYID